MIVVSSTSTAFIHEQRREVNAKIVYLGPGGARASVLFVHSRLDPATLGATLAERVGENDLEAFDFTPAARPGAEGYSVRYHVFSADSGVLGAAALQLLLRKIDALVFVADGRRDALTANAEAFTAVRRTSAAIGDDPSELPLVWRSITTTPT